MALSSDIRRGKLEAAQNWEETLDSIEKLLERTRVMYEQYFMGIQKIPPAQLHRDLERKFRELTQDQIRNTSLRFRFTTLTQKFGSYNTYWRRTLRQIEQGTYVRDLARLQRRSANGGADLSEELVAKLPKRMQDKIRRERARIAAVAERRGLTNPPPTGGESAEPEELSMDDLQSFEEEADIIAPEETNPSPKASPQRAIHHIEESLDDFDFDTAFAQITDDPSMKPAPRAQPLNPSPAVVKTAADGTGAFPAVNRAANPKGAEPAAPDLTVRRPLTSSAGQAGPNPTAQSAVRVVNHAPSVVRVANVAAQPAVTAANPSDARAATASGAAERKPISAVIQPAGRTARAASQADVNPARVVSQPRAATSQPVAVKTQAKTDGQPLPPGMNEGQARDLFARYVKARQLCGESTEEATYEKLVNTLNKQAPTIMKQYGAKAVDFNIVVKDNKVILKAKPKT